MPDVMTVAELREQLAWAPAEAKVRVAPFDSYEEPFSGHGEVVTSSWEPSDEPLMTAKFIELIWYPN